jgi:hypothetical protein
MNRRFFSTTTSRVLVVAFCAATAAYIHLPYCFALPSSQQAQQGTGTVSRRVGAIKAINGTTITLTPDSGSDINITVPAASRVVRIAPGEKDLKNATPIQLQDLQVGDRILVGGKTSDDNLSLVASSVVVMKRTDLDARHQQDLQDWQKRGADGPATAVDVAAGTVTISMRGKSIIIRTSKATVIRRYAPDSVKFDDARPGTLQEIHAQACVLQRGQDRNPQKGDVVGTCSADQVRARGERNADGSEMAAEEIVSGSFPNFNATVNSVDATSSTLSVHDLLSKKTVIVKVSPDSQLRHLTPEMAQGFAAFVKRAAAAMTGGPVNAGSEASRSSPGSATPSTAVGGGGIGMGGGRAGGPPDLQRLLSHAPVTSLADLHKGDAVSILSTQGTGGVGTVVILVSGIEPILQAAPNAGQAMMLAPWSLGGPSADAGGP